MLKGSWKVLYDLWKCNLLQRAEKIFMASKETPKIIYKIENENIGVDSAPARLLGEILINMQNLVFSVGQHFQHDASPIGRHSVEIKDLYTLNVSLKPGCLAVHFTPQYAQSFASGDGSLQGQAFEKTSEMLSSLESDELGYAKVKEKVYEIIDNPECRVHIFNSLKKLSPPEHLKASVEIHDGTGKKRCTNIGKKIFKERVQRILNEDFKTSETEVDGVIVRIKDDAPGSIFAIKTTNSKIVKVQLPEEYRDKVIELIMDRKPIKLLGSGTLKKIWLVDEIDTLEPNEHIEINEANGLPLKETIIAKLSYEKFDRETDFWVVSNDDLGVNGVDVTLEKAQKMFEEDLYADYKVYKGIPDESLAEDGKELKHKLIRLFESDGGE